MKEEISRQEFDDLNRCTITKRRVIKGLIKSLKTNTMEDTLTMMGLMDVNVGILYNTIM